LSCGDWGEAVNEEEFYELLGKTAVLSIYGNHENMDVLTNLYNVKADNLPVLMEDGEVYEISGLRIASINGIIAGKRKVKGGVPRRVVEEFLEIAKRLEGKNVDILLIHETPYLPSLFTFMAQDFRSLTVLEVIRIVKPRLVINGHMHSGGCKVYDFEFGTRYIYIDSSQKERHYLVLDTGNMRLEVWKDYALSFSINLLLGT
jgi:Icc-related predicted phosphoesterase